MTHKLMLELSEMIHDKLVKVKENTRQAVTNQIYGYICKGLLADKIITLEELGYNKN